MKFLVIFSVCAHFAAAILPGLPGANLLSGLTGGGGSSDGDSAAPARAGLPGGKALGSLLGVKISLLSALKNIVSPEEESSVDFENFDNADGGVSGASETGQMFSQGSGFDQLSAHEQSGGSAQSYASQGHAPSSSYGPPSVDSGYSSGYPASTGGHAPSSSYGPPSSDSGSSAGYSYERPPPRRFYKRNVVRSRRV